MRLTSDFWVAALLRKVRGQNGFAYLAWRGATEAGAIFIKVYDKDSTIDLYGPAPQIFYENPSSGDERRFITLLSYASEEQVTRKLEKELDFDLDIWIIDIENFNKIKELIVIVDDGDGHSPS